MDSHIRTFNALKTLSQKKVRIEHHIANLRSYRSANKLPNGLRSNIQPQAIGCNSKRFHKRWASVLDNASFKQIDLLLQQYTHQVRTAEVNIQRLHSELTAQVTATAMDTYNSKIKHYCTKLAASLGETQQRKFCRDGIRIVPIAELHTQSVKRRNRRFKRKPAGSLKHTEESNHVINMSNATLSEGEIQLLSKGLNFCPRPKTYNVSALNDSVHAFTRRLRLREHFADRNMQAASESETDESDTHVGVTEAVHPFRKKSDWMPPHSKSPQLECYIDAVESEIHNYIPKPNKTDNLSQSERTALLDLEQKHDIIIKPADKGSAVVIMNTTDYIAEAHKQLSNQQFYQKLDHDPTAEYKQIVMDTLERLFEKGHIDQNEYNFMLPSAEREGRFYLLPKIHKPGNPIIPPCRPVISTISHPTANISAYLDYHMRSHVSSQKSFVKDTTDYINKTPKEDLPDDTFLLTMDVTSLYSNIPHNEGIEACREAWDTRVSPSIPTKSLVELLQLVLNLNNFEFNGEHYLQISGTAMGSKMSPNYANIFMGKLEKTLLNEALYTPLSWLRFIDDVESKWCETEERLIEFIDFANSYHSTIKFTAQYSKTNNVFLDTTSTISQGKITFDVYSKPTDSHQYLLPTSCHPVHCTNSIPYSQALRVRRICSTEPLFHERVSELKTHFVQRGYTLDNVNSATHRAAVQERSDLLRYKESKPNTRIPFVTTFHPDLPPISKILRKHWYLLENNIRLAKIFPDPPLIAFKRPKNLRDMLVHSKMREKQTGQSGGCRKCNDKRCQTCPHVPSVSSFTSHVTGQTFRIFQNMTCKTHNVIYLIQCEVCGKQYVGETQNALHLRINGHRSSIRNTFSDLPVARHFRMDGHNVSTMSILPIDSDTNWQADRRKHKESYWIQQLRTVQPHGLNLEQ